MRAALSGPGWAAYVTLALLIIASFLWGADAQNQSLAASAALLAVAAIAAGMRSVPAPAGVFVIALVLVGYLSVNSALQGALLDRFDGIASLVAIFAVAVIARAASIQPDRADHVAAATLACVGLIAFVGLVDHISSPGDVLGRVRARSDRLASPFITSANAAATFYGAGLIFALSRFLRSVRKDPRSAGASRRIEAWLRHGALPAGVVVLSLSCLLLTASRAGISAALVVSVLLIASERWSPGAGRGPWKTAALCIAAAAGFFFVLSGDQYLARLEGLSQDSARQTIFAAYWNAFLDRPWFGRGAESFHLATAFEASAAPPLMLGQGAAHNLVLQWLIETGVIGAGLMAALLALVVRDLISGLRRRSRQVGLIRASVLIGLFVFIHGLVDIGLEVEAVAWWAAWFVGLGWGAASGGSRPARIMKTPPVAVVLSAGVVAVVAVVAAVEFARYRAVLNLEPDVVVAQVAANGLPGDHLGTFRLKAIADRALRSEPVASGLAVEALERAAHLEPQDGYVQARLAHALRVRDGPQSAPMLEALDRSYFLLPFADPVFRGSRLTLVDEVWRQAPDTLKRAAWREWTALHPRTRAEYEAITDYHARVAPPQQPD